MALLQALLQLIGELHACPRVSVVITSRVKPVVDHVLELPPLDTRSAVSLLRRHCGAQSGALQADNAGKLVRLCGCNALLLQVLGATMKSGRCRLEVRAGAAGCLRRVTVSVGLLLQVMTEEATPSLCSASAVQDVLEAAQAGGPLSLLQGSRQGGPREHVKIDQILSWVGSHLRPQERDALSSLALFR